MSLSDCAVSNSAPTDARGSRCLCPQASHALPYNLDVLTLVLPQWALRASAWCAAFATSSATTKCRARDLGQLSQLYKLQQKTATTVDRTLPIGATVDGTSQPSDQYTRHTRRGLVIRSGVHTTTEVMHQATCALTFRGSDHVSGRDGRKLQRVCARRVARGAGVLEAACKGASARRRLLVGLVHGGAGQSRHGHDCIRRRSRTPPSAVAMARRWMRLVPMVHWTKLSLTWTTALRRFRRVGLPFTSPMTLERTDPRR